ncbi:MAG: NAD(P)/FAD-dependent oxidoreductase [Acidobacteriota bacterium]
MPELDLLVVGGGPAGLVTALDAAQRGLRTAVIDRRQPPFDKACGEGLMPDGAAHLRRLGVELPEHRPFRGIRYLEGDLSIDGRFPGAPGLGVRRTRLHRTLVDAARAAGVDCRWGVRAEGLRAAGTDHPVVMTDRGPMGASLVVGADGLRSKMREWAGLARPFSGRRRFGVRRHYALAPWSDRVEVYWSDDAEAYVTPVADDEVGVAILWSGRKANFDTLLNAFPALAERLSGAPSTSRDRGAGPLRQRVRTPLAGHVALVGDAAGYVDAITGEGLSLALHQSAALLDAYLEGALATYPRRARRVAFLPEALTHLLLAIEARPRLRRRVLRALHRDPKLFEGFLAVHVRHRSPGSLLPTVPRMIWRLASA